MMSHTPPSSYSPLPHQSGFSSSTSMAERNDLHDMSPEELELECQHLRDENHQLQLRILGVNELARLLQDRSELVQVLEEKNKRLEIAVVRLENRCANYDRMLKSQKGANVPTAKPGQSPFIPGPSRQILEGLMKENSDLKKTVSNLTGKGAAGYLEAVKATQLEEVIDQQKQEIEFLKDQINQLTSTGIIEEKADSSLGQMSSLPASVSDSGPLKRQVIQLQRAMKVKDRFCTLLSQQVSQLQNRLASLEFEAQDGEGSAESTTGHAQQESSAHEARVPQEPGLSGRDGGDSTYKKLYDEAKDTMAKEREERLSLVDKMSKLENQLKEKGQFIDKLEQRCDELTSYHQTLLMEKSELNQMLSETQQKMESLSISGSESGSPLKSASEPNIEHLRKELKNSTDQISDLRAQLEEANIQTAIANSQLGSIESKHAQHMEELDSLLKVKNQEVRGYQEKIHHNELHISDLSEKIKDLEEDIRAKDSEYSNLLREISEGKHSSSRGGIPTYQLKTMSVRSGGAPSLFGLDTPIGPDEVAVKDYAGTPQQPQKIRNPSAQIPLISRGPHKHPPTNLDLHNTQQQPGRASPAPHPSQMVQAKGPPQQQLSTPATPLAPNQGNYQPSYTHPMGPSSSTIPSSVGGGYNMSTGGGAHMMFGTGNVNVPMGQQPRMQPGQGGMISRPRTMPITSPSPTPGSTQRTLGSAPGVRASYTTNHPYTGAPISTAAPYNMGTGTSGMNTQYSTGVAPTGYAGGSTQGGYAGGRGMQQRSMQYSSGQGQPVFGGNTHASHMYGSSSPQLQHQQQFQQQIPYSRAESSSSGYGSGELSYSGGMQGGSGMRPTSPRTTFGQQNPTGGYPGAQQGGPSGQYGMRPTSPRSGTYDPSGSYPGGQGGGAGGQHGFPPRGQH